MAENTFKKLADKWQAKWEEEKLFEANPDKRKKFFVSFPYPYMNAVPHIGHFYTLMRVEAFARYKRLRGFNVLFPQAWHCTGSPIVAAAKRIEEGEEKQVKSLKEQGFSVKEIKRLKRPEVWAEVFPGIWRKACREMGISYDSRREFITTSLNPYYDKFIRWQFNKLKEKGLVSKGEHPVVWDPKTNMPVGDHDRVEGEGETPQEFCLFKFSLGDNRKLVSATLRPDTVMGITNVFINPDVEYVVAMVNGEEWVVSRPAIEKLRNQDFKVDVKGNVKGSAFIGKKAEFFKGQELLVLPASFLDENYGTGIVHSVPSESADDLVALRNIQSDEKLLKKYNLDIGIVKKIEPVEIFDTPGIGGRAAQHFLDKYNVKSQKERDKLEKIKKELYKLTFNKSVFNSLYKEGFSQSLEGIFVSKGQEIIKNDLLEQGKIHLFYDLTGRVVSRSLAECVVKIVKDQWFVKYSDKDWKKKAYDALKQIKLYPDIVRDQFEYVIGWLNDWACVREQGLGTRLPFDEKWLIESLSDSTIYMAYYTIANSIKEIPLSEVNDELFDFVFLGRGNIKKDFAVKMRDEFEYWYPVDFRNSGKDLVQNHLTFFLFNHAAIFPVNKWPKGIGVNGWVRVDGQKMSKSKGNMIPLREMADVFGADPSRITILSGGEGLDDPNWDSSFAKMIGSKLLGFSNFAEEHYGKGRPDRKEIDNWMDSEINRIIKETEGFMEETFFRSAIQKSFFELQSKLKWYLRRADTPNKDVIKRFIEVQVLLLTPFTPHICEEIWSKIGKKTLVSIEKWPETKSVSFKGDEEFLEKILDDFKAVLKLVKFKPKKAFLYVIPKEKELLDEEIGFLKKEVGLEVNIFSVSDKDKYDPENKSKKAKPGKPAIYLE